METEHKLSAGRYESSILDSNGFEVITVNEIAILDNYRERLGVEHWANSPKASRDLTDSETRDLRDRVVRAVNSHDGMLRALKRAETLVKAAKQFVQQALDSGDPGTVHYDSVDTDSYGFDTDADNFLDNAQAQIAAAEGRNG